MQCCRTVVASGLLAVLLAGSAASQEPTAEAAVLVPSAPAAPESRLSEISPVPAAPSAQLTIEAPYRPLTVGGKLEWYSRKTYSPLTFAAAGVKAGISQARNTKEEYGQGMQGYGKRYGAALLHSQTRLFFTSFAYPALLRQDPRYFRKASGGVGGRVAYALSRALVTRSDSGGDELNASRVLGALSASALANTYLPESDRSASRTFQRAGVGLASHAGTNLLREFWPDVKRRLFGKSAAARRGIR